jgi:cyclopropane fatty-acyl-phospholipid synthase-like methyltransferase
MGREMKGLKVLELACGDGSQVCRLGKLGCNVTGVEALHSAYLVAKRRVDLLGLSDTVNLELGDMNSWPVGPDEYDIIIAIQCLQYLSDRAILRLRELLDGIRPGGFFLYSGNTEPHPKTHPPIRFITPNELQAELSGWIIHAFGTETRLVKGDDIRGYVWALAQKPED